MQYHPVPSTLCDICTFFKVAKKREESMDGRTDNWPNLVNHWYMLFFSYRKGGYNMIKRLTQLKETRWVQHKSVIKRVFYM